MALDIVLIGFALSADVVAFLNPCGFAMLPTYVSYFVKSDSSSSQIKTATTSNYYLGSISLRRLSKGALIGLLVTAALDLK